MSKNNRTGNETPSHRPEPERFAVVLPCAPDDFGEFVSGLLGKPQTIEKSIHGVFEIKRDDVINTYHLVDQRIRQQNEATLMQFTVKVIYDDDSSVLLNSLEDFNHYTEVRPIASIGVSMSWTYLIRFKNKRVPEKQEINLSFRSDSDEFGGVIAEDGVIIRRAQWYGQAGVFLRIHHTERTWGVDIESLLTGHVKSLFNEPSKAERFLYQHSGGIGFVTSILFFLSAILGTVLTSSRVIGTYLEKVKSIAAGSVGEVEILSSKLDFLIEVITTGVWPRLIFSVVVFLIIALILAIFAGAWVGSKANNRPRSFVLLSKSAEDKRTKFVNKRCRDWILFGVSIIASIITGVIANVIFSKFFGGIL